MWNICSYVRIKKKDHVLSIYTHGAMKSSWEVYIFELGSRVYVVKSLFLVQDGSEPFNYTKMQQGF